MPPLSSADGEIRIDPTLAPVPARTDDERAVLDAFLDFHRATALCPFP